MSLLPDKAIGNQSLNRRLTASLIVTVLIVSIIAVTAMYRVVSHTSIQGLERKADDTLAHLVGTLEAPLWAVDDEGVKTIGRAVSQDESIVRLIIRNESGVIIFSTEKDQDGDLINRSGRIFHKQWNQEKLAGDVSVSMTTATYKKGHRQALFFSMLIIFLILISIVIVTVVSIRLFLSKPLKSLNEIADRFASGSYDTSGHTLPYLEFQPFGRALARMAERIDQHIRMAREAEAKYRDIFESAIEGIFQSTIEGKFLNINPALVRILGYDSVDELLACHIPDTLYTDPGERNRLLSPLLEQGAVTGYEVQLRRKDEQVIWASITARMVRDQAGNPLYIEGFLTDITKRKQAEEALRESEGKYRTIIETTGTGFVIIDQDGFVLDANPEYVSLTGHHYLSEIVGRSVNEWTADYEKEKNEAALRECFKKGYVRNLEIDYVDSKGSSIPIEINATYMESEGKAQILTLCRDITERKQAGKALKESRELYETLAERSFAGVYVVQEGRFKFLNPQAASFANYRPEELIGEKADSIVHPEDKMHAKQNAKLMLLGKLMVPYIFRVIAKGGQIRWIMETVTTIQFEGKPAILGNSMDITEQKNAEEKRKVLENQLREAQKMDAIGRLAGGIAHDFNNILGAVIGYTEMALGDSTIGDRLRRYLEQIYKAGERAKDLVKQILTFSRKQEQEKKPVLVAPIIKEGINLLRSSLPTTIKITQNIADVSIMVLADPTQIHQVLMNLCTNAAHAMRERGGILDIQLIQERVNRDKTLNPFNLSTGDYARLTVSDTGHGIDSSVMDQIFNPFFTTKGPGEGTGLGLSVVYGIVRDHGGAIDVSSEPGKGTTVTVYFPLIETEELIQELIPEVIPGGSERILFIDDEAALAELGSTMLTSLGYYVTSKMNSIEALEAFRANPHGIDLVITDMTMPNIRGDDLAKELLKIRTDIPIILCTGFSEMISEEKAKSLGIRQLIMKPISKKDLAVAIRDALRLA